MNQSQGLTTQPLYSWENKELHHAVHERFGETLYYYLVRVRPLQTDKWIDDLAIWASQLRIGMLRIYPVFGPWAGLIRVWLHPKSSKAFQAAVAECTASSHPFVVSGIARRWYGSGQEIDTHLLERLSEEMLHTVQSSQSPELLNELVDGQLVAIRDIFNETSISFFVSINIDSSSAGLNEEVVNSLHDYLSKNRDAENREIIKNASIYNGFGFCSILFTGQVQTQDYFEIAKLPKFLRKKFEKFGVDTETFLLYDQPRTIGKEPIGEATFLGLSGVNLFVQSFIPELYEFDKEQRRAVERFIDEEARNKEFTLEDKSLIRDYLIGFINGNVTQMESTLFTYLSGLERYLRAKHKEFIGRMGKRTVNETYEAVGIQPSKKHLPLGDLLKLYSVVVADLDSHKHLAWDWEDLANLRNQVAHGEENLETKWQEHLRILFKQLPRIHPLKLLIESVNKDERA